MKANAEAVKYQVDADGQKALNEAANLLSAEQIAMQVRLALLKVLPDIIRESVKPMEQIDDIKIISVEGLNGGSAGAGGNNAGSGSDRDSNLADQVVNSALRYRGQAPLIDSLLQEIGVKPGDLNGFTEVVHRKPESSEESLNGKTDKS